MGWLAITVSILCLWQESETALHVACRLGDAETARLLLMHAANVDALTREDYSPLHVAVMHDHADLVSVLLNYAASLHLTSQVGLLPRCCTHTHLFNGRPFYYYYYYY